MLQATHRGSGTVDDLYGANFVATLTGTGTINTAAAARYAVKDQGGTIANGYGILIDQVDGTSAFGVYVDVPASNYFQGNVGIGTTTPARELHIFTNTSRGGAVIAGSSAPSLYLSNTAAAKEWCWFVEDGSGVLVLEDVTNGNADRMRIDQMGNVGIGVTSPSAALTVESADASNPAILGRNTNGYNGVLGAADGSLAGVCGFNSGDPGGPGLFGWSFNSTGLLANSASGANIIEARDGNGTTGNFGDDIQRFRVERDGDVYVDGLLTIGAYTLPNTDGANGQILATDGSGTVSWQTVSGGSSGWSLTGNSGTTPGTDFLGTTDNVALEIHVNGLRALRIEPHGTSPNLVSGFSGNSVGVGVCGATIGGGGEWPGVNQVTANLGTVSGGTDNTASGVVATVGGGTSNTASGYAATVSGGGDNTASGRYTSVGGGCSNTVNIDHATVGGGSGNTASGDSATVCGGLDNTASGMFATVCGGSGNIASGNLATVGAGGASAAAGDYSFVVGRRARNANASHDGVFLFADSTDADFSSSSSNEFAARASGGYRLYSSSDLTAGVTMAAGASAWSTVSDVNLKENFITLDGRAVLRQLSRVPITEWNYKTQDPDIRHIGPMAQDFYAAFGLGESDLRISTVDTDGIALVSIQALYELSVEKDTQIAQQAEEINELRGLIEELNRRLVELETASPQ